jgi:hypothetical protein
MLLFVPCAFAQDPSEFYVATEAFSDFGPSWYTYILEAKPDGNDTLVRYIRVANVDVYCPIATVKLAEVRLKATTPAEIVAANNPCAVRPGTVRAAVRKFKQRAGTFETARFGIVAECGSHEIVLHLPIEQSVDMTKMKQSLPNVAHLWEFAEEVQKRAFGDSDVFQATSTAADLQLQQAGRSVAPELRAGKFNKGFADGRPPNDLSDYRGPIQPPDYAPTVESPGAYQFTNYVSPGTPPFAKLARIQGKVELQIMAAQDTGEVRDVVAVSGNPVLATGAVAAARKWRFAPGSITSDPIHVVLDFAMRCP